MELSVYLRTDTYDGKDWNYFSKTWRMANELKECNSFKEAFAFVGEYFDYAIKDAKEKYGENIEIECTGDTLRISTADICIIKYFIFNSPDFFEEDEEEEL